MGFTGSAGAGYTGSAGGSGSAGYTGSIGSTGVAGGITYSVTNSGSGSYTIAGSTANPTLTLVKGFTYYFNVSASTHPFWIKTASVIGTGSAYSSGVTNNGVDVGTITFTVPFDAPDTLYYNCQFHIGMAGVINVQNSIAGYDVATTSTGYFDLPVGTTAQRPLSSTSTGATRINSDTNYFEVYYNSNWIGLQYLGLLSATYSGATATTSGNYRILTFTGTGNFTVVDAPVGATVEVLLLAGGGGGGNAYGGGGGAGGYYYNSSMTITAGSYAVTVGSGGTNSGVAALPGTTGTNTTFNGQAAVGGGGGGEYNSGAVVNASNGGSGGGAGGTGTLTGNRGTGSQGSNGGVGVGTVVSTAFGGGGGGGGAAGSAAVGTVAGAGGVGIVNPITGSTLGQLVSSNYYIAGGGGGGGYTGGTAGSGGSGGGGGGTLSATNGLLPVSMNFSTWTYSNASQANTTSTAPDGSATATLMNVTASSYDLYYNRTGLNSGLTYIFTVWIKLGTATNFAVAFNNTSAWNTVAGNKTYTSADGLNTVTWTKISHSVTGSGGYNMHICGHANSDHAQQTAGTLYMWGPTLTTGSQTQATNGTANTGGGGGGSGDWSTSYGGNGGSGAAIIRYRFQ